MPIIAESGPMVFGGEDTPAPIIPPIIPPITPPDPITTTSIFANRHKEFIDQVNNINACFKKEQISNFTNEEFETHSQIAMIDKYITRLKNNEDVYCTRQATHDMTKTLKRYYD